MPQLDLKNLRAVLEDTQHAIKLLEALTTQRPDTDLEITCALLNLKTARSRLKQFCPPSVYAEICRGT